MMGMTLRESTNAVEPRAPADPASHPPLNNTVLTPTIFHEPWWLATSSAGLYRTVELSSGGSVIGSLPYCPSREFGRLVVGMPMLTHFLGPAVDEGTGNVTTRLLRRISTTRELIRQLPDASHVWFKLHRGVTDTLAFENAGFKTEVQFTCEIQPAAPDRLWAGLHDTVRRVIRRASEKLTVIEFAEPERYMDFYEANLRDKGLRNYYAAPICIALMTEAVARGAGRLMAVVDPDHRLDAAVFTVWDRSAEYYLMSTRRRGSDNGAVALLIWNAIKHAAQRGIAFDLDGIRNPADARFLTKFGGVIVPRYVVAKSDPGFRFLSMMSRRARLGRQADAL